MARREYKAAEQSAELNRQEAEAALDRVREAGEGGVAALEVARAIAYALLEVAGRLELLELEGENVTEAVGRMS